MSLYFLSHLRIRVMSITVGLIAAIITFLLLHLNNSHLPATDYYLIHDQKPMVESYDLDCGSGFDPQLNVSYATVPNFIHWSCSQTHSNESYSTITFEPKANTSLTLHDVNHHQKILQSDSPIQLKVDPRERYHVFQFPDIRGLANITITNGTDQQSIAVDPAAGWGPTTSIILLESSNNEWHVRSSFTSATLPASGCCGIRFAHPAPGLTDATLVLINQANHLIVPMHVKSDEVTATFSINELSVRYHPVLLTVQMIMAFFSALLIALIFHRVLDVWVNGAWANVGQFARSQILPLLLFLGYGSIYGAWVAALWPGLLMSDSIAPLFEVQAMKFDVWFSYAYSFFICGLLQFGIGPVALPIFQATVMAGLASYLLTWMIRARVSRWLIGLVTFLLACSPLLGACVTFHQRSVASGLCAVILLVWLFRLMTHCYQDNKKPISLLSLCGFFTLILFTGLLRRDNLVLSVAAIAALFVAGVISRRTLAILTMTTMCLFYVAAGPLEKQIVENRDERKSMYELTTLINPMGALVNRGYHTDHRDADREIIEKIVPLDVYRAKWHPTNDQVFWQWCATRDYSQADIQAFRKLLIQRSFTNPGIVLGARIETFVETLSGPHRMVLPDTNLRTDSGWCQRNYRLLGLWTEEHPNPALHHFADHMIRSMRDPKRSLYLCGNLAPMFALFICTLLAWRRTPLCALTCGVLSLRLGVVFLAAPGSYLHYLFDLHLFGLILPGLLGIEYRYRQVAAVRHERSSPTHLNSIED